MQREITERGSLLDETGELTEKGWARAPVLEYDRDDVAPGWYRIKEWDYYAVLTPSFGVAFTVADLGYLGLLDAVWLDFEAETYAQDSETTLLPRGGFDLPASPDEGDVRVTEGEFQVEFRCEDDRRRLEVDYPGFDGGRGLEAAIDLEQPPDDDSIVIVSDWEGATDRFYYNQKSNCLPATGTVAVGGTERRFDDRESFGVLDWGRGAWTYRNRWYWGSASTRIDGTRVGWNLGYGFTDRSHASENAVFYDGDVHKLGGIEFLFDPDDYLRPWRVTSDDDRFEMTFDPILNRRSVDDVVLVKSVQNQVFGYYSGHLVLDDGERLEVSDVLGFAEDVYNRW